LMVTASVGNRPGIHHNRTASPPMPKTNPLPFWSIHRNGIKMRRYYLNIFSRQLPTSCNPGPGTPKWNLKVYYCAQV
jgi:hypothetical protein